MPRLSRTDVGGYVYHVINRSNARVQIFDNDKDYQQFESILEEAVEKYDMNLLAYCVMPNHWHLVLQTKKDGDMGLFVGWLANTHTRRWHTEKGTIGEGHLYQGRYKSFLCKTDEYFLGLVRYVERNAKKANLVKRAEHWKWSSAWRRENGTDENKKILSDWPVLCPENYIDILNCHQNKKEEDSIEKSIIKNIPYGSDDWVGKIIKKFGLEQSLRRVGRPSK